MTLPLTTIMWVMAVIATAFGSSIAHAKQPRVAIVIDDIGFQWNLDHRALALDGPVALAIIPEGPHARYLSEQAAKDHREIWAHLPMAGLHSDNCEAGLTCLEASWSQTTMHDYLVEQLAQVPGAIGINNHQGSQFTGDAQAVGRLVAAIALLNQTRSQPLIVMDSRTVVSSHLERLARDKGLATLRRRVFLDHDKGAEALIQNWRKLIKLAHQHGEAIAIGHPREATLSFLETAIGELQAERIELVPPSALVRPSRNADRLTCHRCSPPVDPTAVPSSNRSTGIWSSRSPEPQRRAASSRSECQCQSP